MDQHPNFSTRIASVEEQLAGLVGCLSEGDLGVPIADAVAAVEAVGRMVDAARVRVLAPLVADPGVAERLGYASSTAAVASIARISERSARTRLNVASAVSPDLAITGANLPAPHPIVSDALDSGDLGLDAAALVTTELGSLHARAPFDVLQLAETVMVRLATGVSATGEVMVAAVSVDYLAGEIRQVTAAADPDGARPQEERAKRRREFRVGSPDADGLVPAHGRLMPEIGSLLLGLLEAHRRSPRFVESDAVVDDVVVDDAVVDGVVVDERFGERAGLASDDGPAENADSRTSGQRRHDALAEILMAAAGAQGAPRLDGAPVTVLVTVMGSDLDDADGTASDGTASDGTASGDIALRDIASGRNPGDAIGTMAGSSLPVSRRSIERFIDAGGYRVVTLDQNGATIGISSPQRCFTPIHRLAIAARDGYRCSTPGCTSPHYTLQAHHVIPDRDGGPTAVDNGILLCYWHHQMVDAGPWYYRMISGIPHVRGPGIPDWTPLRKPLRNAA